MRATEVNLKRETPHQLLFAHHPLGGVIFALLGLGFALLPFYLGADGSTKWVFAGAGGFFALIGILGAFWRYELHLDLISRTYKRRRGMWPAAKTQMGSLDELSAILLTQEWERSGSTKNRSMHPWWKISLQFSGWDKTVSIEALNSEQRGHERLEYYAKKLKTWAVDRTGEQEIKRHWDELDQPLAAKKPAVQLESRPVEPHAPPMGSAIEVSDTGAGVSFLLPPLRHLVVILIFGFFGLTFLGFGAFFGLLKSGLYTALTGQTIAVSENSPAFGWIIVTVFMLIGLALIFVGLIGNYGREQISDRGDRMIYGYLFAGRLMRRREILKSAIEKIDLRSDIAPRHNTRPRVSLGGTTLSVGTENYPAAATEIMIRTDKQIIRCGNNLSDEDKRWLLTVIRQLVHGPR